MTKRVVIVGGGFAGLNAAKGLANAPGIGVTLIDERAGALPIETDLEAHPCVPKSVYRRDSSGKLALVGFPLPFETLQVLRGVRGEVEIDVGVEFRDHAPHRFAQ